MDRERLRVMLARMETALAETRAVADRRMMQLDPELIWYYQNRLVGYDLEPS